MSKNITIKEGGTAKQLTVDKLKTHLVSGGTCLWVPEDETNLTTKTITENGTYTASDDGYYGYSQVTVSGIGTATGTDGDGDEAVVTTGEDGELEENKIPSSIVVETPPALTIYADGETIDFFGIVVKGYLKTGGLWTDEDHPDGVIPISELTFPVTVADADAAIDGTATSSLVDGSVPCTNYLTLVQHNPGQVSRTEIFKYTEGMFAVIVGSSSTSILAADGEDTQVYERHRTEYSDGGESSNNSYISLNQSYTYNGKTVHYTIVNQGWSYDEQSISNANALDKYVAWTIVYGDITTGGQEIPVKYIRPSDNKELASKFYITATS